MTIRLYSTLTRRKEDFVPRDEGRVAMYVCGPTVYNHIHIGNARTFLSFDVIRRYLEFRGFEVVFVQNITDVDDKIINKANEEERTAAEVASEYTLAFLEAMDALGIRRPTVQPKATETIPDMIRMVERLMERGHAYEIDGDVYFSVRSFAEYGKLSGRDIDEMNSGSRVDVDERKRDPLDFALWKSAKPGEPHWPSPWGDGRPGWHLECSVMSERELGITFDIHGGASDLIFPHHENEIAQSEAATGAPFAAYWMHGGLLQVNAEKMSKSLGNFMLLRDVLKEYEAPVVRLMMLQTHYRSPLDFSTDRLDEARVAYERILTPVRQIDERLAGSGNTDQQIHAETGPLAEEIRSARTKFTDEMDDDFNTAGALAALFELVRATNRALAEYGDVDAYDSGLAGAGATLRELLGVLGIDVARVVRSDYPVEAIALAKQLAGYQGDDPRAAVEALLAARAAARTARNYGAADAVRDSLEGLGFVIEDTPAGARALFTPKR
ncbi:MAG: cysteine--tRNA ligase [Actinobacteria bacterium HGW-Actinobacteria-10]|nr:MAG: cysteine--tRNA ligase [Actinobacteria bacterium HGW-Actinobacteria-10]